jgi:UDP-GlcNAc:undecaprenyl-phosphate GlcNAc-1-phosphate transferase
MAEVIMLAFGTSFLLSTFLTWIVRAASRRVGFMDRPGGHKGHTGEVALGGGIAIVSAICIPLVLGTALCRFCRGGDLETWLPELARVHLDGISANWPVVLGLTACALVLHITGLIDDIRPLKPGMKFVVQFLVAAVTAWPMSVRAVEALHPFISIALTVLWIVVITNAFNFLDNMDGLSAGVAAVSGLVFALASMQSGQVFVPTLAWMTVGSVAGFLIFNFSPASIFMGDSGSLVIGYFLSVLTILTTYYDPGRDVTPLGVVVPVIVLAVPLYDVISVVVRRVRARQSPFRGDRRHFSHRLVERGMTPRKAVLTIYLATLATALPAVVLPRVGWSGSLLLLVQCFCVVVMIALLEQKPKPVG